MTQLRQTSKLAFFVCGTPSDKRGFEYAELGPDPLPGKPSSYLDRRLDTRKHVSYGIKNLQVAQSQVAMYAQSHPINPNDSETNRGAFLSVGFVCTQTPSLHTATHYISLVGEIAAHLRTNLQSDNTLPKGFRLKDFSYEPLHKDKLARQCSPLLRADLLLQATHHTGRFERRDSFTFGDRDFPADLAIDDHLIYTGSETFEIEWLEIERERAAQLAQTALRAAQLAASEQKRWLAFQDGTKRELEAFADRKAAFDTVLEQLREEIDAAKRITEKKPASTRLRLVHTANQKPYLPNVTAKTSTTAQPDPARNLRIRPVKSRWTRSRISDRFSSNSAFIALLFFSVALVSTMVYLKNRTSIMTEPTLVNTETQLEQPTITKPSFEDPPSTSDIVAERAALDAPSPTSASEAQQED